jgi:phospholipase C
MIPRLKLYPEENMGVTVRGFTISLACVALMLMMACGGGGGGSTKISKPTLNTPIQHVIILIQENRTPDNLFGSDVVQNQTRRLPNADLVAQGACHSQSIALTPQPLDSCWDPDHGHSQPYPSWVQMYDGGKMDGACDIFIHTDQCQPPSSAPANPNYSFVDDTPIAATGLGLIEPYFQMAEQYGFANYMFQTNQGPSFPAHQFLFTGTSAPVAYNDPGDTQMFWQWFVGENYATSATDSYGCTAPAGSFLYQVAPDGSEAPGYTPQGQVAGYPCYEHPTLSDLLDASSPAISWRYYGNSTPTSLWNAPNAINHICVPSGGKCTGPAWTAGGNVALQSGQILTDISNCQLPQVSWVIPDGNWSDHAGTVSTDGGPSWVAAIVNAVGNSWSNSNHKCDYWGSNSSDSTAILVTWDDWGGFYDHINPGSKVGIGYPGAQSLSQQYVYGFRVPLLVISAYANQAYTSTLNHDFGSILNFTEYVFGQSGKSLGEIDPPYHYADYYAQDVGAAPNNYALYDFFNFSQQPRSFTTITGAKYAANCFVNPTATGCFPNYPMDPDNDAKEGED